MTNNPYFKQPTQQELLKEETLYQLLKKETGYYSAILEITKQEHDKLMSHTPFKDISPLLKQKRILLSCVAEVESTMNPFKKHWQQKTNRTDSISSKIKQELSSLDKILKEILQLDVINQKSLEDHLQVLEEKNLAQGTPEKYPNKIIL